MSVRTAKKRVGNALWEAAEIIRACYPQMNNDVFSRAQSWFGRYEEMLPKRESEELKKQFGVTNG